MEDQFIQINTQPQYKDQPSVTFIKRVACAASMREAIVKTIGEVFAPQQLASVTKLGLYAIPTLESKTKEHHPPSCCL